MNSPVIDTIIRIKNGYQAQKNSVEVPFSKLISSVMEILKKEGYIQSFTENIETSRKKIAVELLYKDGVSPLHGLKIISKPGKRMYSKTKDLKRVLGGLGIAIISTPKGIMTDKQAKKSNLGGEVLFILW